MAWSGLLLVVNGVLFASWCLFIRRGCRSLCVVCYLLIVALWSFVRWLLCVEVCVFLFMCMLSNRVCVVCSLSLCYVS